MLIQVMLSLTLLATIFTLAFQTQAATLGIASAMNALIMVAGGTAAATLLAYPFSKIIQSAKDVVRAFQSDKDLEAAIKVLVHLARVARKKGLPALDHEEDSIPDGLIKTGVGLIAYRFNRKNIEQVLRKEAVFTYKQYETAHKLLYSMARVAPAMGLAGTVVGLIRMFSQIGSPENLIGFMAGALLSTLFGVVAANLALMPLCNKLRDFMDQELVRMEIIEEGILDILDQEHPRAMEYKLESLAGIRSEAAPEVPALAREQAQPQRQNG